MAKKRVRKKKTSVKNKKCLFCKENLPVFGVIALFLACIILLGFVNVGESSVATGNVITGVGDVDSTGIGSFLSNFITPEKADPTVIKWIVFFTFALGLWGVFSLIFGKGKGGIIKLLSFPLAFAMVYLLKPEEIFAGLIGYSALGMTIIVVLPFVAVIFFSVRLLEGKLTAAKVMFELIVWYFYLAFLIYFLIRSFFSTETYSLGVLLIILGGIIVSLIAIVKNKPLRKWIAKLNREGLEKEIEDVQHALGAKESAEKERAKRLTEER